LDGVCQEVKRIFLIFLTIKKFEFRIEILTDEIFRELKKDQSQKEKQSTD